MTPAAVTGWVITVWLAALAAIIGFRLLNGQISMVGLLRTATGQPVDPERVQLLMGTLFGVAYYAGICMQRVTTDPTLGLPNVPDTVLILLAGSQSLYLGGKITRHVVQRSRPSGGP